MRVLELIGEVRGIQLSKPFARRPELITGDSLRPRGGFITEPGVAIRFVIDNAIDGSVNRLSTILPRLLTFADGSHPSYGVISCLRPLLDRSVVGPRGIGRKRCIGRCLHDLLD